MAQLEEREAFWRVLALPPEQRAEALAGLPEAMRDEVGSLLGAHEESGDFLALSEDPLATGQMLGPYRIVDRIGQGGMGAVYRAERVDGEFRRLVAIKVIGGRMFAPEAERRFIDERRLLARLDHPNIVRMLDGGVSSGLRYLVMELVVGRPITEYAKSLGVAERLQLFQQVCSAIHYLHQRLVLHRDLKPDNILVPADGRPRVLDFGIARMLDDGNAESSGATMAILSPGYASPEQLKGGQLTPASDLYSLGLLLYELLTGEAARSETGLDEVFDSLQRPVAAPSAKVKGLSPDLDAIVLKALAPEPGGRYASAEEFSADIQRFLEGRPVEARAPTRWYYAARFWSRNRLLGGVIAALLLAVVGGLILSLLEARRAARQAELAGRRFNESRQLIRTVIHDLQPKLRRIDGTVAVRVTLIAESLRYLEALRKDAVGDPGVLRDLIDGYVELASVTGSLSEASLGNVSGSAKLMEKAGELTDSLLRTDAGTAASLRSAANYISSSARQEFQFGSHAKALTQARRAWQLAERSVAIAPGDGQMLDSLAVASALVGDVSEDPEARIQRYEQSIGIWKQAEVKHPDSSGRAARNIALMYRNLSNSFLNTLRFPEALKAAETAEAIDRQAVEASPNSPAALMDLAFDNGALADAHEGMGDFPKAIADSQTSVELRARVVRSNPEDFRAADRLAYSVQTLAELEAKAGSAAAAEREYRRAIQIYEKLARRGPLAFTSRLALAVSYSALARMERNAGNAQGACASIRQARTWSASLNASDATTDYQRQTMESLRREGALGCAP
ncbi:MAG: serine/threonine-protein kinase [Acidobacteriota bacterium]